MTSINQDVLRGAGLAQKIKWAHYPISQLPTEVVAHITTAGSVGLAVKLTSKGVLDAIAFATGDEVVVVSADTSGQWLEPRSALGRELLTSVLQNTLTPLAGFGMGTLVLHIKGALDCDVSGFDISTLNSCSSGEAWSPAKCVGKSIAPEADPFTVNYLWDISVDELEFGYKNLVIRAWISASVAKQWVSGMRAGLRVDTQRLTNKHFKCLLQMSVDFECMDAAKPRILQNDFSSVETNRKGEMVINNTRFKTKIRRGSDRNKLVMIGPDGKKYGARAVRAEGKQTTALGARNVPAQDIEHIRVVGKEDPTSAEKARENFVLRVLQGKSSLDSSPFFFQLWSPLAGKAKHRKVIEAPRTGRLNQSQANVVEAMTGTATPMVVVHGPPGTGKTSTISAAVKKLVESNKNVWIAAQSNVGVKNIAEKLHKDGVDFKLIVSAEFYVEWHEHIYQEISNKLVRSDELPSDPQSMDYLLMDTRVMLCTLSMLSNPALTQRRVFKLVPVERLIIDEASQIGVFDYMHLFAKFTDLSKVCFFGDPKQLPPYGQDVAENLQCIFDLKHIAPQAYFLDTQYRMPTPLGSFISSAVYNSKLKSEHDICDTSCVVFIDACRGFEIRDGKSWKNEREVQTVVHLVRHHYQRKNFCIITPYDAQRNVIQKALKAANLPWECVFNVDSFQGNEAEYVIVSVVRTGGPGFLKSRNRVNVMLTRCTRGMVIVSNWSFMHSRRVQKTLLGELAHHWEQLAGSEVWRDWKDVAEEKTNLPGVHGRRAPILTIPTDRERHKQQPAPQSDPSSSREGPEMWKALLALRSKIEARKQPTPQSAPTAAREGYRRRETIFALPAKVEARKQTIPQSPPIATHGHDDHRNVIMTLPAEIRARRQQSTLQPASTDTLRGSGRSVAVFELLAKIGTPTRQLSHRVTTSNSQYLDAWQ